MESIGQRITRLRNAKGWSRPQLGREMSEAIGKHPPFSGEAIRRYENDIDSPGPEARRALAKIFNRDEAYILFGMVRERTGVSEPSATYSARPAAEGEKLLAIVQSFLDTDDEGKDVMAKAVAKIAEARAPNAAPTRPKHDRRRDRRR